MRRDWCDIREQFRRLVGTEGVEKVAHAIPADPTTVYRLVRGDTRRPTRAVQASIEQLIEERDERIPGNS
jgi:hypothetical protein